MKNLKWIAITVAVSAVVAIIYITAGLKIGHNRGVRDGEASSNYAVDSLQRHIAALEVSVPIVVGEDTVWVTKPISVKPDSTWKSVYVHHPDSFGSIFPGAMQTVKYNYETGAVEVLTFGGYKFVNHFPVGSFFLEATPAFNPSTYPRPKKDTTYVVKSQPFFSPYVAIEARGMPNATFNELGYVDADVKLALVIGQRLTVGVFAGAAYSDTVIVPRIGAGVEWVIFGKK
jgi:hypothetical protein